MADGMRSPKGFNGREGEEGAPVLLPVSAGGAEPRQIQPLAGSTSSDPEGAETPEAGAADVKLLQAEPLQSASLEGTVAPKKFPVVDPTRRAPAEPVRSSGLVGYGVAVVCAVGALVAALVVRTTLLRAVLPLALLLAAVAVIVQTRRARAAAAAERKAASLRQEDVGQRVAKPQAPLPPADRALVLTDIALALERSRGERTSLPTTLPISDRFGLTLLSNRRRDRLVAAVTSDEGAFLFATTVSADGRREMADLLARSTVLGGDDHALDATGPDGASVYLQPRHFGELVAALGDRDAGCFERIVLSDQHGTPLVLDGSDLFVRDKHFDLRRPLEWRSILFQEPFGNAVTLYQGTWVRQGGAEVVLVSLLAPSFFEGTGPDLERAGVAELDVMATRDQRLLQATATDPPPIEQRVAMDGLFVIPLRAVLDQAPRASVQPVRAGHPQS